MPVEIQEWGAFCKTCGQARLFRATIEKPNHVLHALLTIFTCLVWGLIWLLVAATTSRSPWRCTVCGTGYQPELPAPHMSRPVPRGVESQIPEADGFSPRDQVIRKIVVAFLIASIVYVFGIFYMKSGDTARTANQEVPVRGETRSSVTPTPYASLKQKEGSTESRISAAQLLSDRSASSELKGWNIKALAAGDGCAVLVVTIDVMMDPQMISMLHEGGGLYRSIYEGGVKSFLQEHGFDGVIYRDYDKTEWLYGNVDAGSTLCTG